MSYDITVKLLAYKPCAFETIKYWQIDLQTLLYQFTFPPEICKTLDAKENVSLPSPNTCFLFIVE